MVQFGTTGNGSHPNYQVIKAGIKRQYRGINHREDRSAGASYKETNLSEKYGHDEVERFIATANSKKR